MLRYAGPGFAPRRGGARAGAMSRKDLANATLDAPGTKGWKKGGELRRV